MAEKQYCVLCKEKFDINSHHKDHCESFSKILNGFENREEKLMFISVYKPVIIIVDENKNDLNELVDKIKCQRLGCTCEGVFINKTNNKITCFCCVQVNGKTLIEILKLRDKLNNKIDQKMVENNFDEEEGNIHKNNVALLLSYFPKILAKMTEGKYLSADNMLVISLEDDLDLIIDFDNFLRQLKKKIENMNGIELIEINKLIN